MQQYLLNIYQPDGVAPPSEDLTTVMQNVNALIQETKTAGVWVFNGGLHPPSTSTVVRCERGDVLITDGPFVEGKEHIGGFLIIKAPDLDSALGWGSKLAKALTLPGYPVGLSIEVRPFQSEGHEG